MTDLDTMLEAVSVMMGEEFARQLEQEVWVQQRVFKWTPEKAWDIHDPRP